MRTKLISVAVLGLALVSCGQDSNNDHNTESRERQDQIEKVCLTERDSDSCRELLGVPKPPPNYDPNQKTQP